MDENMIGNRDPQEFMWRAAWHIQEQSSILRTARIFGAVPYQLGIGDYMKVLGDAHELIHIALRRIIWDGVPSEQRPEEYREEVSA